MSDHPVGDAMQAASAFAEQLDAENQSPPTSPLPDPPEGEDPIDYLINRVTVVVHESAQMGTEPLTTIASVLAQLYQAKALRDIAKQMREGIDMTFESARFHRSRRHTRRRNPQKSFADILRAAASDFADHFESLESER